VNAGLKHFALAVKEHLLLLKIHILSYLYLCPSWASYLFFFVKADYYFLRMGTDTKTEERTIPRLSRENWTFKTLC